MANTYDSRVRQEEWETSLQTRLNKPTNWKAVAKVVMTDAYITNVPYLTTASEPALQSGTRGVAYTVTDHQISNNTLTISTYKPIANFVDQADLAQFSLFRAVEMGQIQARVISEGIETAMLADHAAWTNFGDTGGGVLGLATTQITVTSSNIDDIVRGIRREIGVANGGEMMAEKGAFIIWRYSDKEKLEQFAQANGFQLADKALKNGIDDEYYFMGMYHYVSNSHASGGHLFAGVRGQYVIGLLKSTFGKTKTLDDAPITGAGPVSGITVSGRLDMGLLTPTKALPILFDVNVV
jgi:hypothetical protein